MSKQHFIEKKYFLNLKFHFFMASLCQLTDAIFNVILRKNNLPWEKQFFFHRLFLNIFPVYYLSHSHYSSFMSKRLFVEFTFFLFQFICTSFLSEAIDTTFRIIFCKNGFSQELKTFLTVN